MQLVADAFSLFESFLRDQSGRIFPQMLDLYHPIRRLYERHFKNNPKPALKVSLFQWDDDPLRDILLANLGGFPSIEETGIDYLEMIEKNLVAEKVDLAGHAPLPPDIFKRATPNWISKFDLEPHYSVINHWDTPGFYLGSVADFDDLINYWNLRATNIDLLFL